MKSSREKPRTFLLCLALCSSLQIITSQMQNLRKRLRRFLIKRELGELMMKKISNSAVIWSCRITMKIDISLIRMMRILEMMTWTYFLMFEKQRNLQLIKVLSDLTHKVKINNLQKSILMSIKPKRLMIFLEFHNQIINLRKRRNRFFRCDHQHPNKLIHMIFLLKMTFIMMNPSCQNLMAMRFKI